MNQKSKTGKHVDVSKDLKNKTFKLCIDTSPSMHSLCFMVFSCLDIRITFTIRIGRAVTKLTVIGIILHIGYFLGSKLKQCYIYFPA